MKNSYDVLKHNVCPVSRSLGLGTEPLSYQSRESECFCHTEHVSILKVRVSMSQRDRLLF